MTRIALPALLLIGALGIAACVAGGEYSGVPDSTVGDWRFPSGTVSTSGRIDLFREQNWTQAPGGRISAR
ncbi:MAG: hypothetical protein K2X74_23740 [Acetobacteraceae bacterium]|nr:hypothetical protein [Acetobacteraceae bacterium]